ncbi:hypothetical protein [Streptomyces sp. NPDC050738]|uniref:hypothetical protein n=1 Tax=Streptomyces sp. NPDC050738 TaxID=3154744 RepID=UPI003437AB13
MNSLAAGFSGFTSVVVTNAGLGLGVALLAIEHVKWWRGGGGGVPAAPGGLHKGSAAPAGRGRDPVVLAQVWGGVAFGAIMVGCPAGLLGSMAGILRWGGNGLGGMVMAVLTGKHGTSVATSSAPSLDSDGAVIVTALVLALIVLRKSFSKLIRTRFRTGVWAGTLLTIGTGVFAYIGTVTVPGVNSLGAWMLGTLVHGSPV